MTISDVQQKSRDSDTYCDAHIHYHVGSNQSIANVQSLGRLVLFRVPDSAVDQEWLAKVEGHQTSAWWYDSQNVPFKLFEEGE